MSGDRVQGEAIFAIPIVGSQNLDRALIDRKDGHFTVGTYDRHAAPGARLVTEEVTFTIAELQSCAILAMEGNPAAATAKGKQMGKLLAGGVLLLQEAIGLATAPKAEGAGK